MAKIQLNVTKKYRPSWSYWHGCRELFQNAKDGEEFGGYPMLVEHHPRSNKLVISNQGVTLDPALLLLFGESSKGDGTQRGRFGEGFNMGCLALVRAGHPVTIYNGDEVWRPCFETMDTEGSPFFGHEVFTMLTRKLQNPRPDFTVEIENVTSEVWRATKPCFLFLNPVKEDAKVVLDSGTVLLGEEHKGKIYHRDIFIPLSEEASAELNLECGYDVKHLELGPDRDIVNAWTLRSQLAQLWTEAHQKDPEKFAPRIYNMLKDGKSETKSMSYRADDKLVAALRNEFYKEHGDDTVPVTSMQDSRELTTLGAKAVLVDRTLHELLEKTGPKVADVKRKLGSAIAVRHDWAALTAEEQAHCQAWVEKITPDYLIVDFADPAISCRFVEGEKKVAIARPLLTGDLRDLVKQVSLQEARRATVDQVDILLSVIFG